MRTYEKGKHRKLSQEEIEKWVRPFEQVMYLAFPAFASSDQMSEVANNVLKTAYENGEIPYEIVAVYSADPRLSMFSERVYHTVYCTDSQEVILDWPPKKEEESEDNRGIQIGAIVQHFKRETLTAEEKATNRYLYQIKEIAQHTETEEKLVVYQALYPPFATYARPADMFFSKVDKDKYPDIKQEYRLEKVEFPEEG